MRIATPEARAALADAVRRRRAELDLTHKQVADRGGPKVSLLSYIENADRETLSDKYAARLERSLDLAPGSLQAIIDGGKPTPLTPKANGDTTLAVEVRLGEFHFEIHPRPDADVDEILGDITPALKVALDKAREAGIA